MNRKFSLAAIACACILSVYSPLWAQQTIGLFTLEPGATDAYLLLAPNSSRNTYLVDNCGREVHSWSSQYQPGNAAYLTEDGRLLRSIRIANSNFPAGGSGGGAEIFDWSGNVLWTYMISDTSRQHHHDAILMPNGNVMFLVWQRRPSSVAIAEGRDPAGVGNYLWSEKLIEVQPSGQNGGTVVWEWDLWDHLIQDFDSTKANYGVVADHPELMNLNYYDQTPGPLGFADWLHANSIAYNASLDQVVISAKFTNEFYIIDHSTTTQEAAGHTGGASGKGGDFLYRWGNPAAYDRGTTGDQALFGQHNVHWIPAGSPDSGRIILFNNGDGRPAGAYSSVEILEPPVDMTGAYVIQPAQAYGPSGPVKSWTAAVPTDFYSQLISGAQQLPNGNIVACAGMSGRIIEVTPTGDIVWEYVNPVQATGPLTQGTNPTANGTFRGARYPANFPGFTGQSLIPGDRLELNPLPLPEACLPENLLSSFDEGILIVFPNPGEDGFGLKINSLEDLPYRVTDMMGRLVSGGDIHSGEAQVDARGWAKGCYWVNVEGRQPAMWVKR